MHPATTPSAFLPHALSSLQFIVTAPTQCTQHCPMATTVVTKGSVQSTTVATMLLGF